MNSILSLSNLQPNSQPPKVYARHSTPFGTAYLTLIGDTLIECRFAIWDTAPESITDTATTQAIAQQIGTRQPNVKLAATGTEFQHQVWRALLQIPSGETRSYTELANIIDRPKSVRAVANAVAANPIAWFIPCHRIIRSDGALGGFAWGTDLKQQMLDWEQKLAISKPV